MADEELSAARLLTKSARRQAAYFVQQAAEKATRAVLTASGIPFGTSHNLGQMAVTLPAQHPLRDAIAALDRYSVAATKYRYPGPTGRLPEPPSQEAVESSIEDVAAFIRQVKQHIGIDT